MITIKSPREIETMAAAGRIVAETLALVARHVHPGVSTEQLDRVAEDFIRSHPGARPSFKGLYDFPATLCTSINQEIVHGIPSPRRVLKEGDLLSVDVGVWRDGLHADSAATFPSATSGTPCSRWRKARGSRSCASWWGTASDRRSTKTRRSRTTGSRSGARG